MSTQVIGLVSFLISAFGAGFVVGYAMGRRHENILWRCYRRLQAIKWGDEDEEVK